MVTNSSQVLQDLPKPDMVRSQLSEKLREIRALQKLLKLSLQVHAVQPSRACAK